MYAWLWITLASKILKEYFNDKLSIFEVPSIIWYFYLSFNDILVSWFDIRDFKDIRLTNLLRETIERKLDL
jgi:hypothetical protein